MKQRLVGAIVLVALAVIFLPMLLDGSGQSGPRDVAIDIPEQPQLPSNRLTQPDDPTTDNPDAAPGDAGASSPGADSRPDTMAEQPAPADERTGGDSTAGQASSSTGDDPAQAAGAAGSGSDSPAMEEPAPDTASAEDTNEATDSADSSERTTDASAASAEDEREGSWVVQVGSFGRETNALVLRDRLRELGFDTFVERAETGDGAVWRVRVGPVSSKDEAELLSERITEERGDPALVMTHP